MSLRLFGAVTMAIAAIIAAPPATAAGNGPVVGDAGRGQLVYAQCQICHQIDRNAIGPRHRGLFGRRSGSLPDYNYSAALKKSGIVWNEKTLDQWLQGPSKMVPGTKMIFAGLSDPQERADVIAYLKKATAPKP